jgi:hypothetical protein
MMLQLKEKAITSRTPAGLLLLGNGWTPGAGR